jgi:hypothetical protein
MRIGSAAVQLERIKLRIEGCCGRQSQRVDTSLKLRGLGTCICCGSLDRNVASRSGLTGLERCNVPNSCCRMATIKKMKRLSGLCDSVGRGDRDVFVRSVLASTICVRMLRISVLVDAVRTCFRTDDCSTSGSAGDSTYCVVDEKYLGSINTNSGRIAGIQAHVMPTLTPIADSIACAVLSNDKLLLFATFSSV